MAQVLNILKTITSPSERMLHVRALVLNSGATVNDRLLYQNILKVVGIKKMIALLLLVLLLKGKSIITADSNILQRQLFSKLKFKCTLRSLTSLSEVPQRVQDLHSMHCHLYFLTLSVSFPVN